jgi:secondary thiamine-phosphate synthase enzyme
MSVTFETFTIETSGGRTDIKDVSDKVRDIVRSSGLSEGQALIFVPGSTAAVTTIEYEPGLLSDLPEVLDKLVPGNVRYKHDDTWGDGNGYAHVRAALIGASLLVPFAKGELMLGTWQQIVVLDFDNRPRSRKIVVQVSGE